MFVESIKLAVQFTRPIHTISRNYSSDHIQRGAATLFFVNSDGWALTCRHVADMILAGEQLCRRRQAYDQDLLAMGNSKSHRQQVRELSKKHGFFHDTVFELENRFVDCVEGGLTLRLLRHPQYDVALIQFSDYSRLLCDSFPVFAAAGSELKSGMFLCRLGFPFVEFTNCIYDKEADRIKWTNEGRQDSPWFPIEGMVTRRVSDNGINIVGFEMSTPGLRGQSGGPVFDSEGRVWGMQFATVHFDLDFDINQEVIRNGTKKNVSDSAFLHVGRCIHVDVLKDFMRQNEVKFAEG